MFFLVLPVLLAIALLIKILPLTHFNLGGFPYYKRSYFLSKAETSFFRVLQTVIKDSYHIFPQVSLKSLVGVKGRTGNYYGYWNKINKKVVDFVVFSKQEMMPLLVIELDDSSHQLPERSNRDAFLDKLLYGVGIKILHIKIQEGYSTRELAKLLTEYGISTGATMQPASTQVISAVLS
jgi:very-short-patch-repair endonuclease